MILTFRNSLNLKKKIRVRPLFYATFARRVDLLIEMSAERIVYYDCVVMLHIRRTRMCFYVLNYMNEF